MWQSYLQKKVQKWSFPAFTTLCQTLGQTTISGALFFNYLFCMFENSLKFLLFCISMGEKNI